PRQQLSGHEHQRAAGGAYGTRDPVDVPLRCFVRPSVRRVFLLAPRARGHLCLAPLLDRYGMGRLIIISNRLPFSLDKDGDKVSLRQSSGGLVSAIKSYFE